MEREPSVRQTYKNGSKLRVEQTFISRKILQNTIITWNH